MEQKFYDKEQRFYDKLKDWLSVSSLDNDNLSVSTIYSFNEDDYYQRVFLVTEKHISDDMVDVYVIRMFGLGSLNIGINLSVDYRETLTYDDLLKNMGAIIKIIIDKKY